jgi:putative FmdB family regulatory protein
MPIFEYKCSACGDDFELLVRSDTDEACPRCGSSRIDKKFSVFASHVDHGAGAAPACHTGTAGCDLGRCGSGLCGIE